MVKESICNNNKHLKKIILKMKNEKVNLSWDDDYNDGYYHDTYHDIYGDTYQDTYNDTSYSDNW